MALKKPRCLNSKEMGFLVKKYIAERDDLPTFDLSADEVKGLRSFVETTMCRICSYSCRYEWSFFARVYNRLCKAGWLYDRMNPQNFNRITADEFDAMSAADQEKQMRIGGYMHVILALTIYLRLLITGKRRMVEPILGPTPNEHANFVLGGPRTQLNMLQIVLMNDADYDESIAENLLDSAEELMDGDDGGPYNEEGVKRMVSELLRTRPLLRERIRELGADGNPFQLCDGDNRICIDFAEDIKELMMNMRDVLCQLDHASNVPRRMFLHNRGFTRMLHERWDDINENYFCHCFCTEEVFRKIMMVLHLHFDKGSMFSRLQEEVLHKFILVPLVKSVIEENYFVPKSYTHLLDRVEARYGTIDHVLDDMATARTLDRRWMLLREEIVDDPDDIQDEESDDEEIDEDVEYDDGSDSDEEGSNDDEDSEEEGGGEDSVMGGV